MKEVQDVYSWLHRRAKALGEHIRSKGLDAPDSLHLRHLVRQLGSGPELALDADGADVPRPSMNDQDMSATFVISTPGKDRMGDVVLPRGCERLLPRNYARNPRVFFSHKKQDMPVGSSRSPDGKLAVEVRDDELLATCYFNLETPESQLTYRMVKRGELETASIGFLPVKAAIMNPEKQAERPETNELGEDLIYFGDGSGWFPSLRFHEWDLTEWSIVPVPANAECISQHLSRGKIEDEALTPLFRKALEPYAAPRKVWSPGASLDDLVPTPTPVPAEEKIFVLDPEPTPTPVPEPELQKSLETDSLISPPAMGGKTQEEDPMKGWQFGARFLRGCMDQICNWKGHLDTSEPELDNGRVRKYSTRTRARLDKLEKGLQKFASQVYPDKFEAPKEEEEPAPDQEPQKAAPSLEDLFPPANSPVSEPAPIPIPEEQKEDPIWQEILQLSQKTAESQARLAEKFYILTGREI